MPLEHKFRWPQITCSKVEAVSWVYKTKNAIGQGNFKVHWWVLYWLCSMMGWHSKSFFIYCHKLFGPPQTDASNDCFWVVNPAQSREFFSEPATCQSLPSTETPQEFFTHNQAQLLSGNFPAQFLALFHGCLHILPSSVKPSVLETGSWHWCLLLGNMGFKSPCPFRWNFQWITNHI